MAWLTGWDHRKKITIPAAQVTGGPHTNISIPVRLGNDADILAAAHWTGKDLRFTSSDETTLIDYELIPKGNWIDSDGIWTWFSTPVALYHNGTNERTFVSCYSRSAYNKCVQIDHGTDTITSYEIGARAEVDDHDNPAIIMRSDGKLIAFYGNHTDSLLRYKISTNAEDASAWGTEQTIDPALSGSYSYRQLHRLTSEGTGSGRIYCLFRNNDGGNRGWCYIYSDDDGATWSAATEFWKITSAEPYIRTCSNGTNRIDILATNGHGSSNTKIFHFYFTGGNWYQSDGTQMMGALPHNASDPTTVFDGMLADPDDQAWIGDIHYDGTNVHILYVVYVGSVSTNQDLYYGKLASGTWSTVKVTDEGTSILSVGEVYYHGGSSLDPSDPTVIWAAVETSGTYEIQKWTTSDGGASWSKSEDITSGSVSDNFRPFVVKGAGTSVNGRLVWCGNGDYTSYTNYHETIRCYPVLWSEYEYAFVNVPSVSSGGATDLYVYYGNSGASDAQDRVGTYDSDHLSVTHCHLPRTAELADIASVGVTNAENKIFSRLWSAGPLGFGVGVFCNRHFGQTTGNRLEITGVDLAGLAEASFIAWVEYNSIGGSNDEHNIFSNFNPGSTASILIRLEPNDTVEVFWNREANTQVGGTISSLTVPVDTAFQLAVAIKQTGSGWECYARINKTAGTTFTDANTANWDATASATPLVVGRGGGTQTAIQDVLRGAVAHLRVLDRWLSKDYTDTLYDLRDGSQLTFGAEEDEPAGRTTKNTDPYPHGINRGMSRWMPSMSMAGV